MRLKRHVIGIDFTPAMIDKARQNAELRGLNNVEFRHRDIEKITVSCKWLQMLL